MKESDFGSSCSRSAASHADARGAHSVLFRQRYGETGAQGVDQIRAVSGAIPKVQNLHCNTEVSKQPWFIQSS